MTRKAFQVDCDNTRRRVTHRQEAHEVEHWALGLEWFVRDALLRNPDTTRVAAANVDRWAVFLRYWCPLSAAGYTFKYAARCANCARPQERDHAGYKCMYGAGKFVWVGDT